MCPLGTDYVVIDALRLAAIWRHKTKSSPQGDTSYSYLNSHISDLRSTLKKIDLISISLTGQRYIWIRTETTTEEPAENSTEITTTAGPIGNKRPR